MERTKLVRGLRIAWSAGWGLVCVLLVLLWVRGYFRMDSIDQPISYPYLLKISSRRGLYVALVDKLPDPAAYIWYWDSVQMNADPDQWRSVDAEVRAWHRLSSGAIIIPHWFPVFVTGAIAAAPWIRWSFSLRALLIATTLIAMILGLAVWSLRT